MRLEERLEEYFFDYHKVCWKPVEVCIVGFDFHIRVGGLQKLGESVWTNVKHLGGLQKCGESVLPSEKRL